MAFNKSRRSDLNRRPTLYESVALPTELLRLVFSTKTPNIRRLSLFLQKEYFTTDIPDNGIVKKELLLRKFLRIV